MKFEVIEKPNDWTKEIKKSESINETQQLRYDYWVAFEDYAFKILHLQRTSRKENHQKIIG